MRTLLKLSLFLICLPAFGDGGNEVKRSWVTTNNASTTAIGAIVTNFESRAIVHTNDLSSSNTLFTTGVLLQATTGNVSASGTVSAGGFSGPGLGFTNTITSTITFGSTITPSLAINGLTTQCPRRITFRCTLTGNITTVAAPTGTAVDGDTMVWEMIQDGTGIRTIAGFNSVYGFGTDITGITLTTNANARDFITMAYNSAATAKWSVVGYTRGYPQ